MNLVKNSVISGVCALALVLTGTSYVNALPAKGDPVLVNALLGKQPIKTNATTLHPSADSTIPQVAILNPASATDGDSGFQPNDSNVTKILAGEENSSFHNNGFDTWNDVYLVYDLEQVRDISTVKLFHNGYAAASSTFKNVKVEVSTDPDFTNAITLTNGDYQETKDTQYMPQVLVPSQTTKGRYIRIWQKGHYIENFNGNWSGFSNGVGFREIEVLSPAQPGEEPSSPDTPDVRNIALHKSPYVYGLAPSNIEKISDGSRDSGYATHNSRGRRWLQFEYRNTYSISRIVLDLAPGNYKFIDVEVLGNASDKHGHSVYRHSNVNVENAPLEITPSASVSGRTIRFTIEKDEKSPVNYREVEIWAGGKNFNENRPKYQTPKSPYTELVWSDEFDNDSVDETKWNIIDGMANHAAIYNRKAVSIKKDGEGSYLALTSKNYPDTAALIADVGWDKYSADQNLEPKVTWSSGRVESKNKYSFQYGRMAVRAKPNDSQGIWPAIWMLAQDETGHDEIDVLEYLGQNPWEAWTTNHFGILGKNKDQIGHASVSYEAWSQAFHVFEVEWSPEKIVWYIDGSYAFSTDRGRGEPLDGMHSRPMFPILETQVGDGWVGPVDSEKQNTKQESEFLIDWIRVYQEPSHNVVRFDDLEWARSDDTQMTHGGSTGYLVQPQAVTSGMRFLSDGEADFENKNNFFYGGQPRYETSRLVADEKNESQSLTYQIPDIRDVHLTTYYRTLADANDVLPIGGWQAPHGHSIRENYTDGSLDFIMESSLDGRQWQTIHPRVVENFVEPNPSYARTTFAGLNLPKGTRFVRIHFPHVQAPGIAPTDIQLAKVTFLAGPAAAANWAIPENAPVVEDKEGVVPARKWAIPENAPVVEDKEGAVSARKWAIPETAPIVRDKNGMVPENQIKLVTPATRLARTGLSIVLLSMVTGVLTVVGVVLRRCPQ
ncbi:family 16 glycosylhydrolase [Arcanobacterium phocae]|uniref:family 16 glycosylhydrolase n=1 Tax=Arcanobacterium phocae TaxID=131112 RepID=UPI001C102E8E|nr:family 16 glycosylhydrolase [Arcanobacterium phocae]